MSLPLSSEGLQNVKWFLKNVNEGKCHKERNKCFSQERARREHKKFKNGGQSALHHRLFTKTRRTANYTRVNGPTRGQFSQVNFFFKGTNIWHLHGTKNSNHWHGNLLPSFLRQKKRQTRPDITGCEVCLICFWHLSFKKQKMKKKSVTTVEILNFFPPLQFILFSTVVCLFHRSIRSRDERDARASGMQIRWHEPHERLKMKREWDKGEERQGNLRGLWQSSCLMRNHLRFLGWGVVVPLGAGLRWITVKVITIHEYEMPFRAG